MRSGALALAGGSVAGAVERDGRGEFAAFDREVEEFMRVRDVPGGALAVVKDRRLVYARGYGWADREARVKATERSLFRIASLSKPITAVAVLQLVEAGKLSMSDPVFGKGLLNVDGRDPRWGRVTIEQLLKHTGGWDRDVSFDPMFQCRRISRAMGVGCPPGAWDVLRFMAGQRLDFDPGDRYAYSNFGYCVLGRVVERITGKSYEESVRTAVLGRIGSGGMRVGATLLAGRFPGEVRYYMPEGGRARSVFGGAPGLSEEVPWPYGGFYLEAMDAHGGWVASAVDLARFVAALHDERGGVLLGGKGVELMRAPPAAPASRGADGELEPVYYGCGWKVRPRRGGKANFWHSGSLPGTATLMVRRWDGLSWVVLFNQRSQLREAPDIAIDAALHRAAARVEVWPEHDLFGG